MLVLETLDHLEHLLTESPMMSLEIVGEPEIVGCPERWYTRECDLSCGLRQTSNETIENIVNTILFELFTERLLSLDEYSWHRLHQIINKYSQPPICRESSC